MPRVIDGSLRRLHPKPTNLGPVATQGKSDPPAPTNVGDPFDRGNLSAADEPCAQLSHQRAWIGGQVISQTDRSTVSAQLVQQFRPVIVPRFCGGHGNVVDVGRLIQRGLQPSSPPQHRNHQPLIGHGVARLAQPCVRRSSNRAVMPVRLVHRAHQLPFRPGGARRDHLRSFSRFPAAVKSGGLDAYYVFRHFVIP